MIIVEEFQDFIDQIDHPEHKERMVNTLDHIITNFPRLKKEFKWNQPMFSDHGTFIIGFSVSKQHMSVAPEAVALDQFDESIKNAGYERTKQIFKIKWKDELDLGLIDKIIQYNIEDKKDMTKFWR
ncbi:uncharacterized protein YdhG (YjbR/CyaY superfamily) [Natronobacillus azotifigens]|uniref:DUF1801 domain-containing protein n=1 Tax=Natronobacillus azotifigens TaxID=472978 RepID=A0A9J6RD42_9BACI|nr:DUF1801 domain-containing protein [Natronobacillus azotifigens]